MKIVKDTYPLLEPFQRVGVDFLSRSRSALLADDVGTGKTAQGIHACQQVGARSVLVICTASIKDNWKKEAIKWGYDERDIHIIDNKNVKTLPETGMFVTNYDVCWRKGYAGTLFRRKFDVLICDEAHYLKNHKAKRSRAVWLRNGYADISTYRWMITATPVLNRPVELHTMLKKLCPDRLGPYLNYIAYTQRYCDGKDGKWGYEALGAENLEELAGRLDGFMLRRTRDEVMPAKTLQKIYLPFTKEIEKHLFTGEESESIRRKIGLGKVDPSAEIISNILESEDKVLVFAYHTDVILGLEAALEKYNPIVLRGATPSRYRQKLVEKFAGENNHRVFIGQIQAAGEGIDGLQHAASVGVFVETNCPPGTIKQAIGRLHRKGQKRPCLFQFLLVEGTVDEQVLNNTLFKDKNIKTILKDEKLGLDFSEQKQKEKIMVETELKRIADALETLVELRKKDVEITLTSQTFNDTPPAPEATPPVTPPATPPVRKPAAKKKGKKKAAPAVVATAKPMTKAEYEATMQSAANSISTFCGDPAKTNALFAKLQTKFQAQFPGYEQVFAAEPKDYAAVCELVGVFVAEEGVV